MEYKLTTPVTREDLAPLRAGDTVLLSGTIYTARDAAHLRMMELLDLGEPLPFPVEGSALYYVGPTPERPGEVIGSAGPTTSGRMDAYSPRLLDLGQAVMIGKGARNQAVKEAVVRNGAVYLAALGGPGLWRPPASRRWRSSAGRTWAARRCGSWRWRISPSPSFWIPRGATSMRAARRPIWPVWNLKFHEFSLTWRPKGAMLSAANSYLTPKGGGRLRRKGLCYETNPVSAPVRRPGRDHAGRLRPQEHRRLLRLRV